MTYERKHIILFSTLIVVFASFLGCKKKAETVDMHLNYFGLIPGRYVIYDVKEMTHDEAVDQHDTLIYQLKTYIGPEYLDNQGRTAREFQRFKRDDNTQAWVQSDVWTAIIDNYKAELNDENQRIIKLVFSPTSDKTWNPNAFNTLPSEEYYYSDIHKPQVIGNLSFDSTITVQQENYPNMIEFFVKSEKYAANIGLIYKSYKHLKIANFDSLNVQKGNEIHYKCIGYGFE